MNRINNKSDALRTWGAPKKRETIIGKEIWFYDLGSIQTTYGSAGLYSNRLGYKEFSEESVRFIELHFDGDKLTYWRTQGVDYSTKKDAWEYAAYGFLIDALIITFGILFSLEQDTTY